MTEDTSTAPIAPRRPSLDQLFDALRREPRRRILSHLCVRPELSVPEFVTERARSHPRGQRGLELELHHRHLPQLEACALIEWKRRRSLVTRGQHFDTVRPLVTLFRDEDQLLPAPWP